MSFPHNGKSLAEFSTQWKNFVHAVEGGAAAPTHNPSVLRSPLGGDKEQPVVGSLN